MHTSCSRYTAAQVLLLLALALSLSANAQEPGALANQSNEAQTAGIAPHAGDAGVAANQPDTLDLDAPLARTLVRREIVRRLGVDCWDLHTEERTECEKGKVEALERLQKALTDQLVRQRVAISSTAPGAPTLTLPNQYLPVTPGLAELYATARVVATEPSRITATQLSVDLAAVLENKDLPSSVFQSLANEVEIRTRAQVDELAQSTIRDLLGEKAANALKDPARIVKSEIAGEMDAVLRGRIQQMVGGERNLRDLTSAYADAQLAADLAGDVVKLISGDDREAAIASIAYKTLGTTQFAKQALSTNSLSPSGVSEVLSGGAVSLVAAAAIMQQNARNHAEVMRELAAIRQTLQVIQQDIREIKEGLANIQRDLGDFRAETTANFAQVNQQLDAIDELVRTEFRANSTHLERSFAMSRGQSDYIRAVVSAARAEQRMTAYEEALARFEDGYRSCLLLPAAGLTTARGTADCLSAFQGHVQASHGQALSGARAVVSVRTAADDFAAKLPSEAFMGATPTIVKLLGGPDDIGPIPNSREWTRGNMAAIEYLMKHQGSIPQQTIISMLETIQADGQRINRELERVQKFHIRNADASRDVGAVYEAFFSERGWDHYFDFYWSDREREEHQRAIDDCRQAAWSSHEPFIPRVCLDVVRHTSSGKFPYRIVANDVVPDGQGGEVESKIRSEIYRLADGYRSSDAQMREVRKIRYGSIRSVSGEGTPAVLTLMEGGYLREYERGRWTPTKYKTSVLLGADGEPMDPREPFASVGLWVATAQARDEDALKNRLIAEFQSNATWVADFIGRSRLHQIVWELQTRQSRRLGKTTVSASVTRDDLVRAVADWGVLAFYMDVDPGDAPPSPDRDLNRWQRGEPRLLDGNTTRGYLPSVSENLPLDDVQSVIDLASGLKRSFVTKQP